MRRAYAPLAVRGHDGKPVETVHAIGWTKPGTVGDRLFARFGDALWRIQPVNMNIRQQRRARQRGYIGAAIAVA